MIAGEQSDSKGSLSLLIDESKKCLADGADGSDSVMVLASYSNIEALKDHSFISVSTTRTKLLQKNIQQRGFASGHPPDY
jgi:hypothetical protein